MTCRRPARLLASLALLIPLLATAAPAGAQTVLWELQGHAPSDGFGSVMRMASHDVDGDGLRDLLLGAPRHSTKHPGTVRVVSAASGETLLEVASDIPDDGFGAALDTAGDVDGDGTIDLLVGSPLDAQGTTRGGCVRILSGADGEELLRIVGEGAFRRLGQAVLGLDDVDGDGVPDLVVSEPGDPVKGTEAGYVMCLSGAEDAALLWFAEGAAADEEFGHSLARLPDLDGDGVDDLAVGAPGARSEMFWSTGSSGTGAGSSGTELRTTGRVAVFSGADGRLLFHVFGPAPGAFGTVLAAAGDVNGDGIEDIITGDPSAEVKGVRSGRAWVLSGKDGEVLHTFSARADRDQFGFAVAGAGDVNGDGADDVIIGAPAASKAGYDAGTAEVLSGKDGKSLLKITGEQPSMAMGYSVCGLGDIDGDGRADIAVGALQQGGPRATAGVVRALSAPSKTVRPKPATSTPAAGPKDR